MAESHAVAEAEPIAMPMERARPFDLPAGLERLRETEPVCPLRYPDGHVGWLISSYALARTVLTDARFSMLPARSALHSPVKSSALNKELHKDPAFHANFLRLDPPDHTRFRRLLAKQFTVREADGYRPRIERIVSDRLDALEEAGPGADLVETFAAPVALLAHCSIYGIEPEDTAVLQRRAEIIVDGEVSAEEYLSNYWEFRAYLQRLIEERRANPTDDLTSYVAGLGDELDDDEIVGALILLYDAGHETTTTMLALGTMALLTHAEQWQALVADRTLAKTAIDELLRYLTIFQYGAFTRTAREDVELDGVTIRAGQTVSVSLAAANRDPERFEAPHALDITRAATGHLAFGHGVHKCLGQHQARVEMEIAFTELARRFPTLRLGAPLEEIPLTDARHLIYSVKRLPVAW